MSCHAKNASLKGYAHLFQTTTMPLKNIIYVIYGKRGQLEERKMHEQPLQDGIPEISAESQSHRSRVCKSRIIYGSSSISPFIRLLLK